MADELLEIRTIQDNNPGVLSALASILLDCVAGGASVGFLASVTREAAEAFFKDTLHEVGRGQRHLLAAFEGSAIVGTVQVIPAPYPNQSHRADLAKLLVRRSSRSQGVATLLMQEAEATARRCGRTLLVLDTVSGSNAERLYLRLGWTRVGSIPDYALFPDGSFCATTIFYKRLP